MKSVLDKKEEPIAIDQANRYGRKARWMSGRAADILQSKTKAYQASTAVTHKVLTHGKRPRNI
ncbi:MAG: hypothetical protein HRT93_02800 [Piscirickettsiaceae bacterium]|nr:hypothetical protein [Piscirickettsiaceae bacterium]